MDLAQEVLFEGTSIALQGSISEKSYDVVSRGWGGRVVSVPVDDLDSFYPQQLDYFEKTGRNSFLKSLGIPPSLYDDVYPKLRENLLTSQKHHLSEKAEEMLLLADDNGRVLYAGPQTSLGHLDPAEVFGLTAENGWTFLKEDYVSGMLRYVYQPELAEEDFVVGSYVPCVYAYVPMFYQDGKKIQFEVGLYKVKCSNGMVDQVNSQGFSLPVQDMSVSVFGAFFNGVSESLKEVASGYRAFIEFLRDRPMGLGEAMDFLKQLQKSKSISAQVVKKALRQVNFILKGEPEDGGAPEEIDSLYDLVDMLTWYSHEVNSLSTNRKSEGQIFGLFYEEYLKMESRKPIVQMQLKTVFESSKVAI